MDEEDRRGRRDRADYERGLPDYHDPTAGFGGAAPTYSALTLRIVLATIGVIVGIVGAVLFAVNGVPIVAVLLAVFAVGMAVDLGWVVHRKRRGEPG